MRRADYMASIVRQVGKLSTDALRYLDQWSFPWGVIPILKAYDEGELLRRVDCDMEVALAMEEIVRCRDCAKADYAEVHMFDGTRPRKWTCTRFKGFYHMVQPDDFCSRGARREP